MLQRTQVGVVGVVDAQQKFLGYITTENLSEMVMIRSSRQIRSEARVA
jgi:Mg/Co/Ni transporter MgtE